ncbi:MAG TPA: ABC transporter transmembrane domain-containing protein [Bdellovibrionales bacterium]|nr:ABC transporter transmembrane domain-containing protein [Bdellovibrionales bacterium]
MNSLKRLLPYLRPYKGTAVLIVIFGLLMAASQAALPFLAKRLIDDVLVNKDASLKYAIPLTMVAIYFVHAVSRFFHLYLLKFTGERIVAAIRGELQKKFMKLNLNFHNGYGRGSGGLLSRVLNDVVVVQWGLHIVVDLIREPVAALFIVGAMIKLDWQLTVAFFLFAPPIVIMIQKLAKSIRKYAHRQQESMEDFTSTLKETLDGVRVIQSFNLESEMSRRFDSVASHYLENRRRIISREELAGPVSEFLAVCVVGALFVYVANQVIEGHSSPGTFVSFLTALGLLNPVMKKLQDAYLRMQQTVAANDRLFEILDDPNEVPQERSKKPFPQNFDKIVFKNVSFSYGDAQILKEINLTVRRGEVIALVGESGSGKSTLVNLLGRFFDPTAGEILIGDTPIREIELQDLRRHIALVTQEVFLFNDTIARNIEAGDFSRGQPQGVRSAAQAANANEFVERMPDKYETKVGDRGGRLSGGERQRISIARAVYKDAPVLILDEATSALDSASELEVQKGLDQLMQGRTAFVIAHRLSTIVKADRILVLKDGRIVEEGQHDGLIARNGFYYNFYKLQTLR